MRVIEVNADQTTFRDPTCLYPTNTSRYIHSIRSVFSSSANCHCSGRDIIGGAKTGSGKTAAFALPILQKLSEDPYGVFAVVLTPTRYVSSLDKEDQALMDILENWLSRLQNNSVCWAKVLV